MSTTSTARLDTRKPSACAGTLALIAPRSSVESHADVMSNHGRAFQQHNGAGVERYFRKPASSFRRWPRREKIAQLELRGFGRPDDVFHPGKPGDVFRRISDAIRCQITFGRLINHQVTANAPMPPPPLPSARYFDSQACVARSLARRRLHLHFAGVVPQARRQIHRLDVKLAGIFRVGEQSLEPHSLCRCERALDHGVAQFVQLQRFAIAETHAAPSLSS